MRDLVIFGAGYPEVVKLVGAINRRQPAWRLLGFIDDSAPPGSELLGRPVLGTRDALSRYVDAGTLFLNNVARTMTARRAVTEVMERAGCSFATLLHPDIDPCFCEIEPGVVAAEGAVFGSRTRIGRHCAIRFRAVVNHDNVLEDHVFIGPGATLCGDVRVCSGAYVGAGSVVKEHVTIGAGSVVGAGAVVIKDVVPGDIVAGVPAVSIRRSE
jgi:sugar O-acyltransferase (sialic acid O-acetyltransferase NeuD family)